MSLENGKELLPWMCKVKILYCRLVSNSALIELYRSSNLHNIIMPFYKKKLNPIFIVEESTLMNVFNAFINFWACTIILVNIKNRYETWLSWQKGKQQKNQNVDFCDYFFLQWFLSSCDCKVG